MGLPSDELRIEGLLAKVEKKMGLPRYNIEYVRVETGEETQHLWLTQRQVAQFLRQMENGDDMVVHRTDTDAEEGVIYG